MVSPKVEAIEGDGIVRVANYKRALLLIEEKIPHSVRKILVAHYGAPGRRLSVTEMGQIAGYRGTRASNLQYGLFAKKLSDAMGEHPPTTDNLSSVGQWDSTSDELGHGGWLMYSELATALEQLDWVSLGDVQEKEAQDFSDELITSRTAETTLRVGQDSYRHRVLEYWDGCAVTGCDFVQVLTASHIVPWAESSDQERLDLYNGLALTPNLDRLFDLYFISFDADGRLQIVPTLSNESRAVLGLDASMKLRKLSPEHIPYLARHFARFKELQPMR